MEIWYARVSVCVSHLFLVLSNIMFRLESSMEWNEEAIFASAMEKKKKKFQVILMRNFLNSLGIVFHSMS